MKYTLTAIFLLATIVLGAQAPLTIEGKSYSNTEDTWYGVNIARTVPTALIFRNNSITSINTSGYMLQAGMRNQLQQIITSKGQLLPETNSSGPGLT